MKVGIIGAVGSTAITIKLLHQHNFDIVGVLGLEPSNPKKISGLFNLAELAESLQVPYCGFQLINKAEIYNWMKEKKPDIIFAVGFSQLLNENWLKMPKLGCIGFHPTLLPKGRGRAPLAWIILTERKGAATFFLMNQNADEGPIFIQEPFTVEENDDANSLKKKIHLATEIALNKWLPDLKKGYWDPKPQDESEASFFGLRHPDDGLINWKNTSYEINLLIKASTRPYPGAFSYFDNEKIIIWKCRPEKDLNIKGVVGRVLMENENGHLLVQCGEGLLWLLDYENESEKKPKTGTLLGYNPELEINRLWEELKKFIKK